MAGGGPDTRQRVRHRPPAHAGHRPLSRRPAAGARGVVRQPVRHDACRGGGREGTPADQPQRHPEPHGAARRPAGLHEISLLQRGLLQGPALHRGAAPEERPQGGTRAGNLLRGPLRRVVAEASEEGNHPRHRQGDGGRERLHLDAGQLLRQGQEGRTGFRFLSFFSWQVCGWHAIPWACQWRRIL